MKTHNTQYDIDIAIVRLYQLLLAKNNNQLTEQELNIMSALTLHPSIQNRLTNMVDQYV